MTVDQLNARGWFIRRSDQNTVQHADGRVLERSLRDHYWYLDGKKKLARSLSDSVQKADEIKRSKGASA